LGGGGGAAWACGRVRGGGGGGRECAVRVGVLSLALAQCLLLGGAVQQVGCCGSGGATSSRLPTPERHRAAVYQCTSKEGGGG
jgi:hypothetical protein